MICTKYFSDGDMVGFCLSGLEKAEKVVFETDGVGKHGRGPFRVKGIVEDRNGGQLHIDTNSGEDAIFPATWFVLWEIGSDSAEIR